MVDGYPGAIYKSFGSFRDAEDFLAKSSAVMPREPGRSRPPVLPLIDKTLVYTDGSYVGGQSGFGVVIITCHGEKITAHGRVPIPISSNNIAEIYAIYVALSLVSGDVVIYTDSHYAVAALTTYIHDWRLKGWSGVANRHLIESTAAKMDGRTVTLHHVAAHRGHLLNEEADALANEGRLLESNLLIEKEGVPLGT
jgi:ribonuclease HI